MYFNDVIITENSDRLTNYNKIEVDFNNIKNLASSNKEFHDFKDDY